MSPTGERLFGGFLGLLTFAGFVMIASPFLNWFAGHGFVWIVY